MKNLLLGVSLFIAAQSTFAGDQCPKVHSTGGNSAVKSGVSLQQVMQVHETKKVDQYAFSEILWPKVAEVQPGARVFDVKDVPGVRKSLDRLDIEKVMSDFSLTRFQAVEVQAILRNHTTSATDLELTAAVKAVRDGYSISKLDQEKIRKAPFTLVLDIDGTLLDQDSSAKWVPGVHEKSFLVDGKKVNHVALNPGAIALIEKANRMGGAVVLFSRNSDLLIHQILSSFKIGDVSLSDYVDGVLTSSHMTVPENLKSEIGMKPISKLVRKDLRIIESDRVLLIDDNPDYVLQQDQTRVVTEFSVEHALTGGFGIKDYDMNRPSDPNSMKGEPAPKLSAYEQGKIDRHLEKMKKEYDQISLELDFLASEPEKFVARRAIFSPLGNEAVKLLMDKDRDYTIGIKKPLTETEALDLLINEPEQVNKVLKMKRKKEKPKPPPVEPLPFLKSWLSGFGES